jgi:hypothetical protein
VNEFPRIYAIISELVYSRIGTRPANAHEHYRRKACYRGNIRDACLGDTLFESRPEHWLSWLRVFVGVCQSVQEKMPGWYLEYITTVSFQIVSSSSLNYLLTIRRSIASVVQASLNNSEGYSNVIFYIKLVFVSLNNACLHVATFVFCGKQPRWG